VLANPRARRARECLLFLAEQNGRGVSPSNREIAAGIGVTQQSQISRLLSSLVAENLVVKHSEGAGKRNTSRLTPRGEEIARALSERGEEIARALSERGDQSPSGRSPAGDRL
jgi:DNA-binding MarR family transcriptional regulator